MKIIQIRPSKRFCGAWVSFEAPGVEPAFSGRSAKSDAIDYACERFGDRTGEGHIYDDAGTSIAQKIPIDGRGLYPQAQ